MVLNALAATLAVVMACNAHGMIAKSAFSNTPKYLYEGKKISIDENALGCLSFYKMRDLSAIQNSGDRTALIAFLKDDSNGCIVARKGIVAFVQQKRDSRPRQNELASVCARPEGLTSCIWFWEVNVEPLD